ncbi:MAG TPA: hypothetical protein VH560_07475 [Polyangia bacterium]|nr:hypothetical protein [Polyangia bacterium]
MLLPVASLVFLLGACGDYSNEDLEFMNAVPQSSDLHADIPAVTSAVELADEAELAKQTHTVTTTFNGLADALVTLVDTVRSYPPTSRAPDSRTWGPFRFDQTNLKNLNWQMRVVVSRDQVVADRFDYEIDVHKDGNADTDWPTFVGGFFDSGHTARRGVGHLLLDTAKVRAEGLDVSDLGMLDNLTIDYDTLDDPLTIDMTIVDLPVAGSADPGAMVVYSYSQTAAGRGELIFDLIGNLIAGPAIEDLRVTSQWLTSGAGRATVDVLSGDGAGALQTECWNASFVATYNSKPWAAGEDVPTSPPPADPGDLCPAISMP